MTAQNATSLVVVGPTTTTHMAFAFYGGDDWEINATLIDENGAPFDLTDAQVLWTMNSETGQRVLADGDFTITPIDPLAGTCTITVAAAKTTEIAGGKYSDAIRIVTSGITSTLAVGAVFVTGDPWAVAMQGQTTEVEPMRARHLRLAG